MAEVRVALPAAPNQLVGRDTDVAAVGAALDLPDTRLLTLTGPPGVGKTRLAVAVATAVADRFADGVAFVDLTAVRDPQLVMGEVAQAVGAGSADRLAHRLDGRELLLVVDNLEHVLGAARPLAELLAGCPRLRVLATSRERLRVRAEREIPVQPLALPDPVSRADLDGFAAVPAVAMLLQRVRGFQPGFAVTATNCGALAEICVRLDGLPLALELAAARLRLFTPGELTARLRRRISLLDGGPRDGPDRHRTLLAALEWSHDLLDDRERTMFRRSSVFVGGWTCAAAEAVCDLGDPVELIGSLVDKSLVRRRTRPDEVAEFVMLESLREYGLQLLAEHRETDAVRARHVRFYADLAASTEALIGSAREQASVESVGAEQGNLRAAFARCLAAGPATSARPLASALAWHDYTRGRLGDARDTIDRGLAVEGPSCDDDDALCGLLMMAATVAVARGELDDAEVHLDRGLEIARRRGDRRRAAVGTAFLGHIARARGRHDEAAAHHDSAGRLHGRLDNASGVAWSWYDRGLLARRRGADDESARCLQESLDRFRDLDYGWAIGCAAPVLAAVELRRGRLRHATVLLSEALDRCGPSAGDSRALAQCLEVGAALACARGAVPDAARLLGAAAGLRERLAAPLPDDDVTQLDERLRHRLGPERVRDARRAGRALATAEAIALARAPAPAVAPDPRSALTPREREVAGLVAEGRTNRQIGRVLGIAEKTTEVHVHNIIRKLGARSRTEVAVWAVTHH
jgi:non-specific serine/threonine protein kinase